MKLSNLKAGGYEKLLELLDPDPRRAELEFQKLRAKLISFCRKRGLRGDVEEGVDEALLRVASKLSAGEEIRKTITSFSYGVAEMIVWESFKARQFEGLDDSFLSELQSQNNPEDEFLGKEKQEHLRHCFEQLPLADQEFYSAYDAIPNKSVAERQKKRRIFSSLVDCVQKRVQKAQH